MLHIESATSALRENLQEMSRILNDMASKMLNTLKTGNPEEIETVIQSDRKVDALQRVLDRQAAELLALINPMASDFRFVFAVLKMNVDMERIGDYCKNICKDFQLLEQSHRYSTELYTMAEKSTIMVGNTFEALMQRKTDMAREVLKADAEIDALELVIMNKAGCSVPETMIARSLERMADHATNICENLVYAIEGVDVRDLREQYKISARP